MESLGPKGVKHSPSFWVNITLGVFTSLIAAVIYDGRIPQKIIDHYGLVRRSELSSLSDKVNSGLAGSTGQSQVVIKQFQEEVASLDREIQEKLASLDRAIRAEQKVQEEAFKQEIQQIDQRLRAIGEPLNQPLRLYQQPVQFYNPTGRTSVEQQVPVPDDAIAIMTAYAYAGRSARGKASLLTIEISTDGITCATGQTAIYKGEEHELFVSTSCIKSLTARSTPYTIKATRKGQTGQPGTIHLQCAIFKVAFDFAARHADREGAN